MGIRKYEKENLSPGEEMDAAIGEAMAKYDLTYKEAMSWVMEQNPSLAKRYIEDGNTSFSEPAKHYTKQQIQDAGRELDIKTKRYMLQLKCDYVSALRQVILEDPELAERAFSV